MPNFQEIVAQTLTTEANALQSCAKRLDAKIDAVIEMILQCKGKLIITGVGKSGLIGAKLAATFASTGTPSFFLHPTEALHGDLGMVQANDVVLAISYSGESVELSGILPHLQRFGVPIIGMCREKLSTLGKASDIWLDSSVEKEACPLGITPTSSTTLTLGLGDGIAVALMHARDFTKEDFASFHPGGALGKALFVTVESLMNTKNLPMVRANASIKEAIMVMSEGRLGTVFIVDDSHSVLGIVSDGDVRRALLDNSFNIEENVIQMANTNPKVIRDSSMLAIDALSIIEEHKIQVLAVTNNQNQLVGAMHLHTLIEAGINNAIK